MGFFDISINKEVEADKEDLITYLKDKISPLSNETITDKQSLLFKNFKAESTFLNYDLNIDFTSSKKSISLNIFGELLNVWILVILIILGILFTYGFGVIIIALFAYYQKKVATKHIDKLLEDIPKH